MGHLTTPVEDIFGIEGVKYVDYSRDLYMDLPILIENLGLAERKVDVAFHCGGSREWFLHWFWSGS